MIAVTLLVTPLLLVALPGTSAAQFASVEVSAQIVPPADPLVVASTLAPARGAWAEYPLPAGAGVVRARFHEKPRAADGSAGLLLRVILDYTAN